jgi:hypothetical protein
MASVNPISGRSEASISEVLAWNGSAVRRGKNFPAQFTPLENIPSLGDNSGMPFRRETQFTTAHIQEMTAAYDSVVAKLKLKPDDPRRGKLATLIVQLAKAGVVDAEKLAEQARAGLK